MTSSIRDRRRTPQRALRDIEAFISTLLFGDGTSRLDRNKHWRRLRALREETAQQRQVFFRQWNNEQDRAHFFGVKRPAGLRGREVAERHIGAAEIVLLGQNIDDFPIDFATDHSDAPALQIRDLNDRGSRRCDKQHDGMCEDDNGLRLRQVADIASHDGEVGLVRRE